MGTIIVDPIQQNLAVSEEERQIWDTPFSERRNSLMTERPEIGNFYRTLQEWANPNTETNPALNSFYQALLKLPESHPIITTIESGLAERSITENSSGANTANVAHRAFMYIESFGHDNGDVKPVYTDGLDQITNTNNWLAAFDLIGQDPHLTVVLQDKIKNNNAMANKPTRYRSAAKFITTEGEKGKKFTIYDVGASVGFGTMGMLSNGITANETQEPTENYSTSDHIAGAYCIDIAEDPITSMNGDILTSDILKWAYACSFHPGEEAKKKGSFEKWRDNIIAKRKAANGRFFPKYSVDAEQLFLTPELFNALPATGTEPLIIFNTIIYQLPHNKQQQLIKAAENLIKKSGGQGSIIITDFFENDLQIHPDSKGNQLESDNLVLPLTNDWRATDKNPFPYRSYAIQYQPNINDSSQVTRSIRVLDRWTSGRCIKSDQDSV